MPGLYPETKEYLRKLKNAQKGPCKGECCTYYIEHQVDVDRYESGCSHPDFDEHIHSIRYGPCPGFVELSEEDLLNH